MKSVDGISDQGIWCKFGVEERYGFRLGKLCSFLCGFDGRRKGDWYLSWSQGISEVLRE